MAFLCAKIFNCHFSVRIKLFPCKERRKESGKGSEMEFSLALLFPLFLNSCFKCMKTKHKFAVKCVAVCQIFTAANMFCSNYLFQLENDSSQDCSNGGIVSDVFGD